MSMVLRWACADVTRKQRRNRDIIAISSSHRQPVKVTLISGIGQHLQRWADVI